MQEEKPDKAYQARQAFAMQFHGDIQYTQVDHEEKRTRLLPIIRTSSQEEEYLQAAIEYIRTYYIESVAFAAHDSLERVKKHPRFDEFISFVIIPGFPQRVYRALWKTYGSKPDIIFPSKYQIDGRDQYSIVWSPGYTKREQLERCPVCHITYYLPDDRKEHAQQHEIWLRDSSITREEYVQLLSVDNDLFNHIQVKGYYYADGGLFRKGITNRLYDYEDDVFRRGDMLGHLELEYIHQHTIGMSLKHKKRVAEMFAWSILQKIAENDELWEHVIRKLDMEDLFRNEEPE